MDILDPTQPADLAQYGRVTFQGAGAGAGVEAMQSVEADGADATPVPNVTAQPVGANWELVLIGEQLTSPHRYVSVAGATTVVGQFPRYASGLPGTAPAAAPPTGKGPGAKPPAPEQGETFSATAEEHHRKRR